MAGLDDCLRLTYTCGVSRPTSSSRSAPLIDRILAEIGEHPSELRALVDELDRRLRLRPLERLLSLWDLSAAEAARFFGVSRQAFGQWLRGDVPGARAEAVADLGAATDVLDRYVKRERIAAVVRRGAPSLGGASLYELATAGRHREVREAVEAMFDLRRVQP